jgi:hypothetical protein
MVSTASAQLDESSQQAIRDFIGLSLHAKEVILSCNIISSLHHDATTKLISSRALSVSMQATVHHACGEFPVAHDTAAVVETSTRSISEMGVTVAIIRAQMEHARDLFVAIVNQTEQVTVRAQGLEHSTSQFLKRREQATPLDRALTCS